MHAVVGKPVCTNCICVYVMSSHCDIYYVLVILFGLIWKTEPYTSQLSVISMRPDILMMMRCNMLIAE